MDADECCRHANIIPISRADFWEPFCTDCEEFLDDSEVGNVVVGGSGESD